MNISTLLGEDENIAITNNDDFNTVSFDSFMTKASPQDQQREGGYLSFLLGEEKHNLTTSENITEKYSNQIDKILESSDDDDNSLNDGPSLHHDFNDFTKEYNSYNDKFDKYDDYKDFKEYKNQSQQLALSSPIDSLNSLNTIDSIESVHTIDSLSSSLNLNQNNSSHSLNTINSINKINDFDQPIQSNQNNNNFNNNQKQSSTVCKFFLMGSCKYGNSCKFYHPQHQQYPSMVPNPFSQFVPFTPMNPTFPQFNQFGQYNQYPSYNQYNQFNQMNQYNQYNNMNSNYSMNQMNQSNSMNSVNSMNQSINLHIDNNQFFSMCKDQQGCRMLQRELEKDDDEITNMIFSKMIVSIVELMKDQYGNYLCQKVMEVITSEQKIQILQGIQDDFESIAKDIHGTRSIQKLISLLEDEERYLFIEIITPHVIELIYDINGNHIIQECLKSFEKYQNEFIFDQIVKKEVLVKIATHKQGCCVIQRCIDYGDRNQLLGIIDEIVNNVLLLVQDQYGNYVVQYVLEKAMIEKANEITMNLLSHLISLSKQKFSSNVIEKLLRCDGNEKKELMFDVFLGYRNVEELLKHAYANYVIQTCLDACNDEYLKKFTEWIEPHLDSIKNSHYYKKIQSKLFGKGK